MLVSFCIVFVFLGREEYVCCPHLIFNVSNDHEEQKSNNKKRALDLLFAVVVVQMLVVLFCYGKSVLSSQ